MLSAWLRRLECVGSADRLDLGVTTTVTSPAIIVARKASNVGISAPDRGPTTARSISLIVAATRA
jgi:hypothetical protein